MLAPIIANNLNEIKALCLTHKVKELYVFGSAVTSKFNDKSDVDLLIRFSKPKSLLGHISISHQLQDALGKEIDLVTESELSPHIRENVLRDLKVIYGE